MRRNNGSFNWPTALEKSFNITISLLEPAIRLKNGVPLTIEQLEAVTALHPLENLAPGKSGENPRKKPGLIDCSLARGANPAIVRAPLAGFTRIP